MILTSSTTNYDKKEKRLQVVRMVLDSSLFSFGPHGSIETVDHIRGLKYIQNFNDNLNIIENQKSQCKSKPYTKVVFRPDYERLGLPNLRIQWSNYFKAFMTLRESRLKMSR